MLKDDEFHYKKIVLSKPLQQVVKYAWVMKSNGTVQSDYDLLIPDGYPEIIFVLSGAYYKKRVVGNEPINVIQKSCVVGVQSHSVLARRGEQAHLLGLKLYPWSAAHLFKGRLNLIANKNVSLDDFAVEWLRELNDQLQSCKTETDHLELISSALSGQIANLGESEPWGKAKSYLSTILEMEGQVSVQELAQQHCVSIRHFQRKFKQYYGLSPKKIINLIRFKQLYKSSVLQKKLPDSFLAFGYYDQTHFIKDFQKQLGITPSKSTEKTFLKRNDMAKLNL